MATKTELLKIAAELQIVGRHDMDKATLEARIAELQTPKTETVKAPRRVRTGNSGNQPYQPKQYALAEIHLDKAPKQIRGIFAFMQKHALLEINGRSLSGPAIAQGAVDEGFLVTKSDPAVIFAYYAREMERRGMVFVGYDYDHLDLDDDMGEDDMGEDDMGEDVSDAHDMAA